MVLILSPLGLVCTSCLQRCEKVLGHARPWENARVYCQVLLPGWGTRAERSPGRCDIYVSGRLQCQGHRCHSAGAASPCSWLWFYEMLYSHFYELGLSWHGSHLQLNHFRPTKVSVPSILPLLLVMGWMVSSQKIHWSPSTQYLWTWPYLDI